MYFVDLKGYGEWLISSSYIMNRIMYLSNLLHFTFSYYLKSSSTFTKKCKTIIDAFKYFSWNDINFITIWVVSTWHVSSIFAINCIMHRGDKFLFTVLQRDKRSTSSFIVYWKPSFIIHHYQYWMPNFMVYARKPRRIGVIVHTHYDFLFLNDEANYITQVFNSPVS